MPRRPWLSLLSVPTARRLAPHTVRVFLSFVLLPLLSLILPSPVGAIELNWFNGSSDITLARAMRGTLVVPKGASEPTLPDQWHLIWSTDSCDIGPVPRTCTDTVAQVIYTTTKPSLSAILANRVEAAFCA